MQPAADASGFDAASGPSQGPDAALTAATRIQKALEEVRSVRNAALAGLHFYPARATDPRLYGPVLVPCSPTQRRAQETLAAAGGDPLRDAAGVLVAWSGPAVRVDRLKDLLEMWVPDDKLDAAAAAVTRRLLCDAAGLAVWPPASHAAIVSVLSCFAQAAVDLADDAGLIDEDALVEQAVESGWDSRIGGLAEACGLVRVSGRLAVRDNRVASAKAALLSFRRPAGPAEVAELADRSERTVSLAFSTCASIVRAGPKLWTACEHKRLLGFAAAAAALADDAGLINEADLMELAGSHQWDGETEDLVAGCRLVRVFDHVAAQDSVAAAAKAVLLNLARPATAAEVARVVGRSADSVRTAFSTCGSIVRTSRRHWSAHLDPMFADVAAAGAELADNVGLINEQHLAAAAVELGWGSTVEEFVQRCGYIRLSGLLALDATPKATAKAAVLHLGGSATVAEVAAETGSTAPQAAAALRLCKPSLRRGSGGVWTVDPTAKSEPYDASHSGGRGRPRSSVSALAPLARLCVDDAGLVDEDCLAAVAAENKTSAAAISRMCGLVRVKGRLALSDSTPAVVKATMMDLDRPAPVAEIARITARTPKSVSHAFAETASIIRVGRQRWTIDTPDGALGEFAAAALELRDDVGLIDETQLRARAARQGHSDRFDELVEACGFSWMCGRLGSDPTDRAAIKSALLSLDRPASPAEIAEMAGLAAKRTASALASIDSLALVGPAMWVAKDAHGGVFAELAAALALCRDDVGLIDENHLEEIAAEHNWPRPVEELIDMCGLPRLSGRLSMADTAAAAAKAVLLDLGRAATLDELQNMSGHSYSAILNGFARCESVERISAGKRGSSGLLRVV